MNLKSIFMNFHIKFSFELNYAFFQKKRDRDMVSFFAMVILL